MNTENTEVQKSKSQIKKEAARQYNSELKTYEATKPRKDWKFITDDPYYLDKMNDLEQACEAIQKAAEEIVESYKKNNLVLLDSQRQKIAEMVAHEQRLLKKAFIKRYRSNKYIPH